MIANTLVATVLLTSIITINGVERAQSLIPCYDNTTCSADLPGSVCIEDVCICKDKMGCKPSRISSKTSKLGGPCALSTDCLIDDAECSFSRHCKCVKDKKPSEDQRSCVEQSSGRSGTEHTPTEKPQGLRSTCSPDSQCPEPLECKEGLCQCPRTMHESHGECINSKALGGTCEKSKECVALYSVCYDQICTCKKDYITHKEECLLPATNISSSCYEDIQCTKTLGMGSICKDQVCVCKKHYEFKEDVAGCVTLSSLHAKCTTDEDCNKTRFTCEDGVCVCKEPLVEQDGDCVVASASTKMATLSLVVCFVVLLFAEQF